MKLAILIGSFIFSLIGCSSLNSKVAEINQGEQKQKVLEELGRPDAFMTDEKDSSIVYWGYKKRSDMCIVAFRLDTVIDTSCMKNPNYVNPVSAAFTGMGQGLQNASHNQTHCVTTGSPGFYTTNCN
jgi:hypothetical protein